MGGKKVTLKFPRRRLLDLSRLAGICGLSQGLREALVEAARVMLTRHRHTPPSLGQWARSGRSEPIRVVWELPDAMMIESHANEKDATEDGAYALAISAMASLGFRVRGRTAQGSGSDWWMVQPDHPDVLLKLEVSGISEGGSPGTRLVQKTQQGRGGLLRRPGIAVVIRFQDVKVWSEEWP